MRAPLDPDLLIHVRGTEAHTGAGDLLGMSRFGRGHYLRRLTTRELLDVHYLTDEDIAAHSSFASKIGAVTDPALELPLGRRSDPGSR
jgi:hypothetical protein